MKDKINYLYNFRKLPIINLNMDSFIPKYELCDVSTKVGIEVEVENVKRGLVGDPWIEVDEGSLRDNGLEYKSPPLSGAEIEYALLGLYNDLPGTARFSPRTSIHVHINVRDLEVWQLLNIIVIYLTVEKLLYSFAGPERYKSIFCIPLNETAMFLIIHEFIRNPSLDRLISDWDRYSGLNLKSITKYGTLEYRHMEGHRSVYRILDWVNLILHIHKFARENPIDDILQTVSSLNTNSMYDRFLRNVFKDKYFLLHNISFQANMEDGVRMCKEIFSKCLFQDALLKSAKISSPLLKALGILEVNPRKTKGY